MKIRRAIASDIPQLVPLRYALWDFATPEEHARDLDGMLKEDRWAVLFGHDADGTILGFVEATLRHDYVEGSTSSPVGYVEGWYVIPERRKEGIGRRLIEAAEQWAREQGCSEMGSDAELDNEVSHCAHRAIGYEEVIRTVHYHKRLIDGKTE